LILLALICEEFITNISVFVIRSTNAWQYGDRDRDVFC
jgi:hypothetical protein